MEMYEKRQRMFEEGRSLMLEWRRLFRTAGLIPSQRERMILARQVDLSLSYVNQCLSLFLE